MIRRAVERGVTPERIANDLKVDISHIQKKLSLLLISDESQPAG